MEPLESSPKKVVNYFLQNCLRIQFKDSRVDMPLLNFIDDSGDGKIRKFNCIKNSTFFSSINFVQLKRPQISYVTTVNF